jgi:hypothetical protein
MHRPPVREDIMTPRIRRSAAPAGLRHLAVLTLFAFGCATVRAPASTIHETVPVKGGAAEPQLELWLESGRAVSPAESAEATAQAKAALESALARAPSPQGDTLLVVRAQGVARTASRRTDQRAAVAGLVVGAVVVVAAVVAVLVASHGKGGGSSAPRIASSARPTPVPRVAPVRAPPVFVPRPAHPVIAVDVSAGIEIPPPGGEPPPGQWAYAEPPPAWGAEPPPQPWTPPRDPATVTLPPPPPIELDRRGFFEGDTLRLELFVVDRRSGAPLWIKVVDGEVDPRDARAVEQLLSGALADTTGWNPAG